MAPNGTRRKSRAEPEARKKPGCQGCPALCCHDLVLRITKPRTAQEIDSLRWQLHFDTVTVYIVDGRWHQMIAGKCIYLDDDNLCTIYDRRSERCRRHNPPDCERYGECWDVMIRTPDELDAYLAKEKERRRARRRAGS